MVQFLRPTSDDKTFVTLTASFMQNPLGRKFLKSLDQNNPSIQKALVTPAPNMKELNPMTPKDLDSYWAIFFATGDAWPVHKIISALTLGDDANVGFAMAETARWSLTSNAKTHPRVMEILQNEALKSPPQVKKALKLIIENSTKEKAAS